MNELKDTIVFVTGASSGIGMATARRFAAAGCRLLLAARRRERLEELRRSFQTETHLLQLDVRDRAAVASQIAALPKPWSEIDILINNAGLSRGLDKLHEGNQDDWDEMIDTNVKGLLYVSRAVIPGMVQRNRGQIVNIGSIAGHELYPGGNVYCASKHAVNALTRGLLMDLADTPIRVCTIDPGLVETEFSQVRFHGDTERAAKVYQGYQPLSGEDIAESIFWVCSRPPHVQIAEMIVLPTAQGSAMVVHKKL